MHGAWCNHIKHGAIAVLELNHGKKVRKKEEEDDNWWLIDLSATPQVTRLIGKHRHGSHRSWPRSGCENYDWFTKPLAPLSNYALKNKNHAWACRCAKAKSLFSLSKIHRVQYSHAGITTSCLCCEVWRQKYSSKVNQSSWLGTH